MRTIREIHKMEESIGLGYHVRHNGITDVSSPINESLGNNHATPPVDFPSHRPPVFVLASRMDVVTEVHPDENDIQHTTDERNDSNSAVERGQCTHHAKNNNSNDEQKQQQQHSQNLQHGSRSHPTFLSPPPHPDHSMPQSLQIQSQPILLPPPPSIHSLPPPAMPPPQPPPSYASAAQPMPIVHPMQQQQMPPLSIHSQLLPPPTQLHDNTIPPANIIPPAFPPPGLPPQFLPLAPPLGVPPSFSSSSSMQPPHLLMNVPPSFPPPPCAPPSSSVSATVPPSFPSPPSHLPQLAAPSVDARQSSTTPQQNQPQIMHPPHQDLEQQPPNTIDAVQKARAIALRFHQDSTANDETSAAIAAAFTINNSNTHNNDFAIDNINYAKERQNYFQNERIKLQTFRLKNLEYVMKHEEKELRKHVECMNQMTQWEERQTVQRLLQQEKQQRQRQQQQLQQQQGGGIGSKEQRHAERIRKKQHLDQGTSNSRHMHRNNDSSGTSSRATVRAGLYLTNLATDGSTTERTLRSLFSSYGRLDRITMYRNRSTGEYKGDGIVVFGRDAVEEHERKNRDAANNGGGDLVDVVCSQVRVLFAGARQ